MNDILIDAERVSKGGTPRYTRDQAEVAMMELAKAEARPGEGVASAFARLCESDERFQKLYDLGVAADLAEEQAVLTKADPGDRFAPLLMQMAKYNRHEGETLEACASRLLVEDPIVRDAYAATQGL
jgi:hypothetical protein